MFLLLNVLIILVLNTLAQEFTYEEQNNWPQEFPICGGVRQSPININTYYVRRNLSLNLNFVNYDQPLRNAILINNGHTAQVTLNQTSLIPYITGSAVNGIFILENFHFHWGENDYEGSEHSVDGGKASFELHLVHYNQKYGNFSDARTKSDGLAVLGIAFYAGQYSNFALQPIINGLSRIIEYNTSTVITEEILLNALLPYQSYFFFRYNGSLTTPTCDQIVNWIVFYNALQISSSQISRFRQLYAEPHDGLNPRITNNIRDLQPLNGRIVEVSN